MYKILLLLSHYSRPTTPIHGLHPNIAHQSKAQIRLSLQHRVGQAHEAAAKAGSCDPRAANGVEDEEDGEAGGQRPQHACRAAVGRELF